MLRSKRIVAFKSARAKSLCKQLLALCGNVDHFRKQEASSMQSVHSLGGCAIEGNLMLAGCPPLDEPMDVNGTANGAVVEWKRRW